MTVELYIEKLGTYIKTNNPKYDKGYHAVIIEKWIKEDKEDAKQVFGEEAEHINIDDWIGINRLKAMTQNKCFESSLEIRSDI